jgi:hypothetical protein
MWTEGVSMDGLSDESERDATTEDLPSSGKRIRTQDCRDEGSVDFFGPDKYRKMVSISW